MSGDDGVKTKHLGAGPVYLALRDVPDDEWPTGGFVACSELERLAAERRVTADERNGWVESINRLNAQVERLQAVAMAALAYMNSTSRHAGDDYCLTVRRRPRMALDDAVATLQPGDLPGETKEGP